MTNKSKLLICSGDSFTAGDELAGDFLVPGYTSFLYPNHSPMTNERKQVADKLRSETMKLWTNKELKKIYDEECKKRAWPSYLEKILKDTDVLNCSTPGASNEEIVHRAIDNFCKLQNNYKEISVIIMATSYNRMGYPIYDKNYGNEYNYNSYTILHYEQKVQPDYMQNDVHNFFFRMKDYDRLMKSISALSLAKTFFETNGTKINFVDSCLWDGELNKFDYEYKEKVLFFKRIIPILTQMSSLEIENVLPAHHFTEKTHKEFAEHISKLI